MKCLTCRRKHLCGDATVEFAEKCKGYEYSEKENMPIIGSFTWEDIEREQQKKKQHRK